MKFHEVPRMRNHKFVTFLEELTDNFRNGKQMIDFMRACKCDSFGRGNAHTLDSKDEIFAAAKRCLDNFRIQRELKATNMPNFQTIKKDETFKSRFLEFRAKNVR